MARLTQIARDTSTVTIPVDRRVGEVRVTVLEGGPPNLDDEALRVPLDAGSWAVVSAGTAERRRRVAAEIRALARDCSGTFRYWKALRTV